MNFALTNNTLFALNSTRPSVLTMASPVWKEGKACKQF